MHAGCFQKRSTRTQFLLRGQEYLLAVSWMYKLALKQNSKSYVNDLLIFGALWG